MYAYPSWQVHVKLPAKLEQLALMHTDSLHSSTSEIIRLAITAPIRH